jgi:hypothetical protein
MEFDFNRKYKVIRENDNKILGCIMLSDEQVENDNIILSVLRDNKMLCNLKPIAYDIQFNYNGYIILNYETFDIYLKLLQQ